MNHKLGCPRLQFWDAGDHEAACTCDALTSQSCPDGKPHPTYTVYIVRVSEHPGFRDVRFDNKAAADRFAEAAIEDGSYWGREERITDSVMDARETPGSPYRDGGYSK